MTRLRLHLVGWVCGCWLFSCVLPERDGAATRHVYLGAQAVASVHETSQRSAGQTRVMRRSTLLHDPDDTTTVEVTLNTDGFVVDATYHRRGDRGERHLELVRRPEGPSLRALGRESSIALPELPIVFLETLHRVTPGPSHRPVLVVDLASTDWARGEVRWSGQELQLYDDKGSLIASVDSSLCRVGPGAFSECHRRSSAPTAIELAPGFVGHRTLPPLLWMRGLRWSDAPFALDGPGQRGHQHPSGVVVARDESIRVPTSGAMSSQPTLFIEADDPAVRAFAARHAKGNAWLDAIALAEAISIRTDTTGGGGPPSALQTLRRRSGDCDDMTALLVASLRALGHAAWPVVGYRLVDERFVPHAWAELNVGGEVIPVDATIPGIGPFPTHLRLFEGLGSALTIGRILGSWTPSLPADENSPGTSSAIPEP